MLIELAAMDRKLFLAIMKVHDISVDHKAVADELTTTEQPCTKVAVERRLQRIKAQIKEGTGDRVASPKPKAPPRKRTGSAVAANNVSPTKKGKGKAGKAKPTKEIDDDGDGETTTIKEEDKESDEQA